MIVEDVGHRRRQLAVSLRVCFLVALAEEEELELRAEHGLEAERLRSLDLRAQDLSRRGRDGRPVVPQHVAEDERRRLEPRNAAQRPEVGHEPEVAVAAFPTGDLIAGHRIHLHLEGEQVVAPLDTVVDDLVEEVLGVDALAEQPALHVGEGDDDRVDRTDLDLGAQLAQFEHARILSHIRGA